MSDASVLEPLVRSIESTGAVDRPANLVSGAMRSLLPPGKIKDAVSGTWLGHPLHPALTDLVIGSFTSATLVDLLVGEDGSAASERLIMLGIAAYGPTALAGASDWADGAVDDRVRRIGIVHASGNLLTLGLYVASLAARRRGARARGVALGVIGSGVLTLGAYLGGHLSFRRGIGPDQTVFDPGAEEWQRAADSTDIPEGQPVRVIVDDTPVLLVRQPEGLFAIHDRCSHRGCSLTEGELDGTEIVCGCHSSRFSLRDGSLIKGPAVAPQPAFDVREREGVVEVSLRS